MTPAVTPGLPTHKDLPVTDGSIVENFAELFQGALLVECFDAYLRASRPDALFALGCDNGIYWKITDPPLAGCKSPDFLVILGVPQRLDGEFRRSYVLWQEKIPPVLVAEFVSGDGSEERDRTPNTGKMWVYENGIKATYYAIFDVWQETLEVHHLQDGAYHPVAPNAAGRSPVSDLGLELGIWHGTVRGQEAPWLRAWDATTKTLLPSDEEAKHAQRQRADAVEGIVDDLRREAGEQAEEARKERQEADEQRRRADRLAELLRKAGIDPDGA